MHFRKAQAAGLVHDDAADAGASADDAGAGVSVDDADAGVPGRTNGPLLPQAAVSAVNAIMNSNRARRAIFMARV
jgi:hypothetical protein